MNASAVILARAGSKGLPGKNAALVAGRPCVAWTIDHARASARVARTILSTDDPTCAEIARSMGVEVVHRPPSLAGDASPVDDAARHAMVALDLQGPIVILYANAPVRPADLTDRAVGALVDGGHDSVQSVCPVGKHHPWWTCRLGDRGELLPWEGETLHHGVYRRQDLPPAHIPDGGVIACTRAALMLEVPGVTPGPHAFFGLRRGAIETREGDVVDIDNAIDQRVADAVLRERAGADARAAT